MCGNWPNYKSIKNKRWISSLSNYKVLKLLLIKELNYNGWILWNRLNKSLNAIEKQNLTFYN